MVRKRKPQIAQITHRLTRKGIKHNNVFVKKFYINKHRFILFSTIFLFFPAKRAGQLNLRFLVKKFCKNSAVVSCFFLTFFLIDISSPFLSEKSSDLLKISLPTNYVGIEMTIRKMIVLQKL